jgi:hypothetical protein
MAHLEWQDRTGQTLALHFDAVQVVEHSQTALVTSHPVEDGPDISDHIRPELPRISLTGTVTNTPIRALAQLLVRNKNPKAIGTYRKVELAKSPAGGPRASALQGGVVQAGINALMGAFDPTDVEGLVFEDLQSRVKEVTDILTDVLEERRLVKFVDEARDYEDMAMERRAVVRSAEGGKAAQVQIDLVQIKIVESSVVDSPIPSELRGQAMSAVGSAAAALGLNDSVDEKKKTAAKSLAASLFDGALGGIGF